MKSETYQQVTDTIARAIAAGTPPWRKPWRAIDSAATPGFVGRPLRENGQPYRGVNTIVLWEAAMRRGFTSPYWLTYRKAAEIGAQVRKGAKSELAFYVGTYIPADKRENLQEDDEASAERAFLKAYHVFNASEIDGLPDKYAGATIPPAVIAESGRIATADTFVDATGASVRHGGNRAFYAPSIDAITMPTFGQFETPAAYYATLLHELTHWTGADSRLARLEKVKRHGDEAYAAEELVAELGAAFLCADLGIANETEQAAAYVEHWLKILHDDNRAIFRLASLAERAADYLKASQPAPAVIALPAPESVIALPAPESPEPAALVATYGRTVVATLPAPAPVASAEPATAPAPAPKPAKPRQATAAANAAAAVTVAGFKPRNGRKWSVTGAQRAKRTLADATMPAPSVALAAYPPSFQRAYADVMAAGAVKPRDGEHFAHLLGAAKVNAAAMHGSRWAFAHGASVVARIPARWASIAVHGRTCRLARDQRMPAADFWPGGELPAGLDAIVRDASGEPVLYGDTNRDPAARRRYERDYLSKPAAEPAPMAEAAD